MAIQAPAKNDTTALEAWVPRNLDTLLVEYPTDRFNVLVPTQHIRQVNPFLVPDVAVVKLSVNPDDGQIYHDAQMAQGRYAPTAKGLSMIRNAAGIDELQSYRSDDGSDPEVVEWTVLVEMQLPSGQRVRAHGTKRMDMKAMTFASDAHRRKQKQFLLEHAQTKALNRAIRSLLSIHGSMPQAAFQKPFAIVRWVPNMNDPDVRRRMLDNLLPATTAAFGPDTKAIEPGAPVIEAPQAPDDDDDATEGEYKVVQTNGHATVHVATGEIVAERPAASDSEPDWFGDPVARPSLVDRLRAYADEAPENGDLPQLMGDLRDGFRGIPRDPNPNLVIVVAYGAASLNEINARQAAAIIRLANELGWDQLQKLWVEAATLEARKSQS